MAHRPFTDRAGYTRHCWECKHAQEWDEKNVGGCCMRTLTGYKHNGGEIRPHECSPTIVLKTDSPNNPCSIAGGCEHYER